MARKHHLALGKLWVLLRTGKWPPLVICGEGAESVGQALESKHLPGSFLPSIPLGWEESKSWLNQDWFQVD